MATTQRRPKPPHDSKTTLRTSSNAQTGLKGAWWKWGMGLLMTFVIYGAFFIAKGAANFGATGNTARIVFFHVPAAILSFLCYVVATVYAFHYLTRHRDPETDIKSATAMELGLLFCILTT